MLPTELLAVQRWRDQIRPKYSKLSRRDVSAAEAIIRLYGESVGAKRGAIRERVAELENAYGDYRFVRGLAALVERACTFASSSHADPLKVRHMLFAEASRRGFPTSPEERKAIVLEVASALALAPSDVEESMYADLDSEEVLESCPSLKPMDLLKQYNLSLTQTLLFSSTEMEFTASGNWQRIFRAVKFHGLMYTASKRGGLVHVRLDGPTSLFKLTRRYGTALAKVLPEIMRGKPWRIEAIRSCAPTGCSTSYWKAVSTAGFSRSLNPPRSTTAPSRRSSPSSSEASGRGGRLSGSRSLLKPAQPS
jgi:predicted nuclease of restriction endonuclease-like RecB superfamily